MARPKLGETETERMQLKITTAEIEAIDDWRFANRVPSRSEAVRRLVQIGLRGLSSLPELSKRNSQVYETAAGVLKRFEPLMDEDALTSLKEDEVKSLFLEGVVRFLELKSLSADALILALQLEQELVPFRSEGKLEKLIEGAEAAKADARMYWEKAKLREAQFIAEVEKGEDL